jgi:long-chain fatty acid transport protein
MSLTNRQTPLDTLLKLRSRVVVLTASLVGVLGLAQAAVAQGYGLYEQGTCQMARAGAGVAAPCDDGSAVFFNPAGLALDVRPVVSGGVTGIAPRGTFTNTGTSLVSTLNPKTYPAPTGYFALPVGSRFVIGAGIFAPYGLTTDWPTTSEGRFLGYYSSVKSLYVQPTAAVKVTSHVLVGGGLDITHTSADLRQHVDLSTQPIPGTPLTFAAIGLPAGTDFADVRLTGSANHVGAHFGILVQANQRVSFGARYLTRQTVGIDDGSLAATQIPTNLTLRFPLGPTLPAGTPIDPIIARAFAPGGPLASQAAATSLPLPDQFVAGIAYNATPRLKLLADYQYTHWAMFDVLTVTPQTGAPQVTQEQYGDTSGVRLGGEYAAHRAIVRGGFDAHGAAAPDQTVTPRLPEAPRWELAGGVGVPADGPVRIDLAYMFAHQQDRGGRSGELPNNGTYHYYANLFSAQVVIRF